MSKTQHQSTEPTTAPALNPVVKLLTGGVTVSGVGVAIAGFVSQLINGVQPGANTAQWAGVVAAISGAAAFLAHHIDVGIRFQRWLKILGINSSTPNVLKGSRLDPAEQQRRWPDSYPTSLASSPNAATSLASYPNATIGTNVFTPPPPAPPAAPAAPAPVAPPEPPPAPPGSVQA